jgi:hypothetical protein
MRCGGRAGLHRGAARCGTARDRRGARRRPLVVFLMSNVSNVYHTVLVTQFSKVKVCRRLSASGRRSHASDHRCVATQPDRPQDVHTLSLRRLVGFMSRVPPRAHAAFPGATRARLAACGGFPMVHSCGGRRRGRREALRPKLGAEAANSQRLLTSSSNRPCFCAPWMPRAWRGRASSSRAAHRA